MAWPPNRAKNVPLRFRPELPNPFPGKDQSTWGYPITLQVFRYEPVPNLTMTLYEGKARTGPEVPTLFTSQHEPGNVELVPRGAFCLIPKAPLKPGTAYAVVAAGFPEGRELTWSFRTGGE